jgi:hypothetical protein
MTNAPSGLQVWHPSARRSRTMPWIDVLSFLSMCLLSTAAYGLACWIGRLF